MENIPAENENPSQIVTLGDLNGDGKVDAKDVTAIRRYLAGGWGVVLGEAK